MWLKTESTSIVLASLLAVCQYGSKGVLHVMHTVKGGIQLSIWTSWGRRSKFIHVVALPTLTLESLTNLSCRSVANRICTMMQHCAMNVSVRSHVHDPLIIGLLILMMFSVPHTNLVFLCGAYILHAGAQGHH